MEDEYVEPISLIDFDKVWETSLGVGDSRHLWDYLNYNGHIKVLEEGEE